MMYSLKPPGAPHKSANKNTSLPPNPLVVPPGIIFVSPKSSIASMFASLMAERLINIWFRPPWRHSPRASIGLAKARALQNSSLGVEFEALAHFSAAGQSLRFACTSCWLRDLISFDCPLLSEIDIMPSSLSFPLMKLLFFSQEARMESRSSSWCKISS